jgi:hypothetical protein
MLFQSGRQARSTINCSNLVVVSGVSAHRYWISGRVSIAVVVAVAIVLGFWRATPVSGSTRYKTDTIVYDDALASGWESWSWSVDLDVASSSPVHSGNASLAVTYTGGWGALFLHSEQPLSSSEIESMVFYLHGGSSGGQQLSVTLMSGGDSVGDAFELEATAGAWTEVTISMADLGSPGSFDGIAWQDATGGSQPTFYLDEISLVEADVAPTPDSIVVYDDALASGWQSWSWSVDLDLASSSPVHSGSASLAVTYTGGWGALFLHSAQRLSSSELESLVFHLHGGSSGGQQLSVTLMSGGDSVGNAFELEVSAGAWTEVTISMADLGSPGSFDGIAWQDATGGSQPTYYLDDIALIEADRVPTPGSVSLQAQGASNALSAPTSTV